MRRLRPVVIAALAGLCLLCACNANKSRFQLGIPGTRVPMRVGELATRGAVIDATLEGQEWQLRTFAAASPDCLRVLMPGERVDFLTTGAYGAIRRETLTCEPIGIGSLAEWRAKQPRGDEFGSGPISSARATYRTVYTDEEVVLLRGSFPLARRLGFLALDDGIAVVTNHATCARAIADGQATLEYFQTGDRVLTLGSPSGRCEIVGLLRPPTQADLDS